MEGDISLPNQHHAAFRLPGKNKPDGGQDFFSIESLPFALIAAVADGVSSEIHSAFGAKTASEEAVRFCKEHLKSEMSDTEILQTIYLSFEAALEAIIKGAQQEDFDVRLCSTTLSLVVYKDAHVYFGHVGDSGIFAFFTDGTIDSLTLPQNDKEDDDAVYTLANKRMWTFEKSKQAATSVLLCTDGVWSMFTPKHYKAIERKHNIHRISWYIHPEAILAHNNKRGLQAWLEDKMIEIINNYPELVRDDDTAIVILHDNAVSYTAQAEEYYAPLTQEQEKLAEFKHLYPHLEYSEQKNGADKS